jgi:hypothetical protein
MSAAPPSPTLRRPEAAIPRPEKTLRALSELRRRIRKAFLFDGAVALALALLLWAPASFLLDYMLVLPRGVRAVLLAAAAGGLAWVFLTRLWRPRKVALGDEALAVLVEVHAPEMRQSLITAVELSREHHRGAAHVSPALIAEVVRQAEEASAAIQPSRVLDLRPLRKRSLLLLALAGVLIAGAATRPDLAGIWSRRLFGLSHERWPKSTELTLLCPRENPVTVALGDDLLVEAHVRGAAAKVELDARADDGARWREPMTEAAEGVYRKLFENVAQPFHFQVVGGDDELPEVEVKVRIQPSLARVDAWYRYPDYTRLPQTAAEKPVSNPTLISVPTGTRVVYRAYTDRPVKQAFFVFRAREEVQAAADTGSAAGSRPPPAGSEPALKGPAGRGPPPSAVWPDPGAKELQVAEAAPRAAPGVPEGAPVAPPQSSGGSMFEGEFTVERDGLFFFQLRAADDLPGRSGKSVSVRAIADRKPSVRILEPGRASEEVSAEATVPMEFLIRDDYGVKSASVEGLLFLPSGEAGKPESFPLTLEPVRPDPRGSESKAEHRPKLTLELQKLAGIAPGARFQYFARADDFGGQTGESEHYVLHILKKQDLQRILNDRLMLLRDQLREVFHQEESARKDLQNYQGELETAQKKGQPEKPPTLEGAAAQRLSRNRQDQEKVTAGLTRVVKEFDSVLTKMESNRIGEEKEKSWIGGLRGEVEAIAREASPKVEKMIEELRGEAARAPQPLDRLGPVVESERRIERDIQMLVYRLSEFGDINAVIQQLREVQIRQQEIRDRTRQKANREGGEGSKPGGGGEEGSR